MGKYLVHCSRKDRFLEVLDVPITASSKLDGHDLAVDAFPVGEASPRLVIGNFIVQIPLLLHSISWARRADSWSCLTNSH